MYSNFEQSSQTQSIALRVRHAVWRKSAKLGILLLAVVASVWVAAPASADAQKLTGVVSAQSVSQNDSSSAKSVVAVCPAGKDIVGGGGWAVGADETTQRVALKTLQPLDGGSSSADRFIASAAEIGAGTAGDWYLAARAVCSDPVSGHQVVVRSTGFSSSDVKATTVSCPSGTRALGSGSAIGNVQSGVGLQVSRTSASGDIARSQAREQSGGFSGSWNLTSYAICAQAPQGYEVATGESPQRDSESVKIATATCSSGKVPVSAGAGITKFAPGNVTLSSVYPLSRSAQAVAGENTPTEADWDFIVARAVCVER